MSRMVVALASKVAVKDIAQFTTSLDSKDVGYLLKCLPIFVQ